MESLIDIFTPSEKEYFIDDKGVIWLHGTLLCKKLGYKNVAQTIYLYVDNGEKMIIDNDKFGKKPWFVNEYGVWGLIFKSKTSEADEFRQYLKYEVLPAIRRKDFFISEKIGMEQLMEAQAEIENLKRDIEKLRDNNGQLAQENRDYRLATCNALHAISTDGSIDEARASKMRAELSKALK